MANTPSWVHDLADELADEIAATADRVAAELAPPPDAYDGPTVSRAQYLEHARRASLADPTYLQRDYDRMAPVVMTLPDGTPVRAPTGVKNFTEKWRLARPDLYLAAASREGV